VFLYSWRWRWRTLEYPGVRTKVPWFADGVDRTGQHCRVLVQGSRNTALIEFEDGYRVITSSRGLRRRPDATPS
jgi:hypothetical protein